MVSIAAPVVLAFGLARYLYPRVAPPGVSFLNFALFLGAATSITAFPMLARILVERRMSATQLGSVALACAAISGIATWSLLAYILAIIKSSGSTTGIWWTLAGILVWGLVMFLGIKPVMWVYERAFERSGELNDGQFAGMVLLMLVSAVSSAYLGLHPLFGAFLFGAILPKHNAFMQHVRGRFETVTLIVFLPLYFAFSGLRTNTGLMQGWGMWLMCAVITLVAIAGKVVFPMLTAWASGMSLRESAGLGALLNTRGLISLIVFNIGLDMGVISAAMFSMLVVMTLINTLLTLPLLNLFCPRRMFETSQEARTAELNLSTEAA
jgi:Kef-type K+ transport system membrane component KefB